MKTFKVTVDGQQYNVQVEEVAEKGNPGAASAPTATVVKQAAVPAGAPHAAEEKAQAAEKKTEPPRPAIEGGAAVNAPMPGSILEVKVSVGDSVKDGDVLVVLEAMKMENELTAFQAGTVSQVLVKKGDTVNSGDPLIVLA